MLMTMGCGKMSRISLTIGGIKLKKFNPSSKKKPTFKDGGWAGIIVFREPHLSHHGWRYVVCRSMHLERYLKGINFNTVKGGKYGTGPQTMSYQYMDVFYYELDDWKNIRDMQGYFRKEITKMLKECEQKQLSLDFNKKVKPIKSKAPVIID